ncbi:aldolase/citrate lyase family protein [Pseudochelatococcus lubricantis]|uniref:aldolase/citrate lyase family protein n=1 Tax=Pseudochelatococcus lubricantis TaxID=1538102 RepID=UPI0035E9CDFC
MRSLRIFAGVADGLLAAILASEADGVVLDLVGEDARAAACAVLRCVNAGGGRPAIWMRAGGLHPDPSDDDLAAVLPAHPAAVVLPAVAGPEDIEQLGARLRVLEARLGRPDGETRIVAVIGTAAGVMAAPRLRPHPRLAAFVWEPFLLPGAETPDGDVSRLSRGLTLLAASHAGVPAIDASARAGQEDAAFREACLRARRDGFAAMTARNEAQVHVINAVFAGDGAPD